MAATAILENTQKDVSPQKFLDFTFNIFAMAKLATSNLLRSLGFPRPIIKLHAGKKWAWPWARGASQNLGFPFNISATTEGSDFKICRQEGFANAHHKISQERKSRHGHELREFLNILEFPFNISASTEVSDFKVDRQVGFAKAHNKITPGRKNMRGHGLGEYHLKSQIAVFKKTNMAATAILENTQKGVSPHILNQFAQNLVC